MLEALNDYLQLGLQAAGNEPSSGWPLALAAALVAVAILRRQSDE